MRWVWITGTVLLFAIALALALSSPAVAFDGVGAGTFVGTSPYYGGLDGFRGGNWNPSVFPDQLWQRPAWDNRYPFWDNQYPYWDDYRPRGFFSDCYSRCMAQGYGPNYCAQVCPV